MYLGFRRTNGDFIQTSSILRGTDRADVGTFPLVEETWTGGSSCKTKGWSFKIDMYGNVFPENVMNF